MINTFRNILKLSGNTDHNRFDDNGNHRDLAERIFRVVNEYRTSIKKPSLIFLSSICDVSQSHSQYLAEHDIRDGDWAHVNWSEETASNRSPGDIYRCDKIRMLPQRFREVAENVGTGDLPTAQLWMPVHQAEIAEIFLREWLASTRGHRETIEDDYTHSGIAVTIRAMPEAGDRSLIFVTQHFAK